MTHRGPFQPLLFKNIQNSWGMRVQTTGGRALCLQVGAGAAQGTGWEWEKARSRVEGAGAGHPGAGGAAPARAGVAQQAGTPAVHTRLPGDGAVSLGPRVPVRARRVCVSAPASPPPLVSRVSAAVQTFQERFRCAAPSLLLSLLPGPESAPGALEAADTGGGAGGAGGAGRVPPAGSGG